MKKIYIIRHGESEFNEINKGQYTLFCGQSDCALSKNGIKQAEELKYINTLFDFAYISDSIRTKKTFEHSTLKSKEIIFTKDLRERSLGEFEGKNVKTFFEDDKHKKYWLSGEKGDFKHSFVNRAPLGENYKDVCDRVEKVIKMIDQTPDNSKILIISHYIAIRCLLFKMGKIEKKYIFNYKVTNCDPIIIQY
ncbi:histidine phosphatase family protein [Carnobacterium maltaromaticum]|uniref:histidine phosphatase family protein n=1 Tax=Carnobacterium maltaromaticum TaxID=2751 RepID=UPI0039BDD7DF